MLYFLFHMQSVVRSVYKTLSETDLEFEWDLE